jgi:hypothetical protein
MSFGITSLKKNKNDARADRAQHITHVVLGHDLAAVLKLVALKDQLPPEQLRLITPHLITRERLCDAYERTVSVWRDNVTTLAAAARYPRLRPTRVDAEAQFYKEGQWHRFGGRARPMELAAGEAFFLAPRQNVPLAGFFSEADWAQLDDVLMAYQSVRVLERIEKTIPTDLVSPAEWTLLFHDLGEVTCAELWLSLPSRVVLKASHHGQSLPPELAGHLVAVHRQGAIALHWEFSKELHPEARTLFIPQSMTHEWGHFVVDVHAFDGQAQAMDVLILLNEEEPTPEGMADKIKLAKRVLDRAFPGFEKHLSKEHISASEDFFETPPAQAVSLAHVPGLHVIGAYAAAADDTRYWARSAMSV